MRFSYLVAVEIFFSSIIFIGIACCLSFEDVKSELTTFFLEKETVMEYDDFKCRKDSHSGLLLNADININEKEPEYELLLCLEEFMYAFRSFFEDTIKGEAGQQDLFDKFCRYVAAKIKLDKKDSDDNSPDAKRKKACDVLFLILCKLFFIDKEKNDVCGDVRYFVTIFKLLHKEQGQILEYLETFIQQVYKSLEDFVVKLKIEKFNEFDIPGLLVIDDRERSYGETFVQTLFSDTKETFWQDDDLPPLPGKKIAKEIFYLKSFSTPGKIMHKKMEKGYVVLIYDDFVVFENINTKEEIVWKREPKNNVTPYSFYRKLSKNEIKLFKNEIKLSKNEIREIDIFAKNPDKGVIDILEKEIKEQMLYDAEQLYCQVKYFIDYCTDLQIEGIWQSLLVYCEKKHIEIFCNGNELIKNFVEAELGFEDFFNSYLKKIQDKELTEDLWSFSIKIRKCFLDGINKIFEEYSQIFYSIPWFKGLVNVGNSCYINALSQNLFDYKEEMQGMVNKDFLTEISFLQLGGIKGFSKQFAKITGYNGRQQDSHEFFQKIFIPKSIEEKGKTMSDPTKISIEEGNEQRKRYNSFFFCFDSEFKCLKANAIKEEKGRSEEILFKNVFNGSKKEEIKSIHDVLNSIYDYLSNHYCNLSLFYTTIDTYCDHNKGTGENEYCCKKYIIKITKSSEIEVDSYEVYNGLDLLSLIKKKVKEKISGLCTYLHPKKDVDVYREQTYHNFSDFLVINLKRFTSDNNVIPNSIPIPDNICFDGDRYDITGIVCHFGNSSYGHYIAYKKKFGLWFEFNDSRVSVVGPSLLKKAIENTYMLFFKKNKKIKDNNKKKEPKKVEEKDQIKGEEEECNKEGVEKLSAADMGKWKQYDKLVKLDEERKRQEKERLQKERRREQEEERKKKEENEKKKREAFLFDLLQYYSIFNKRYFGIKNIEGKTFVEYLQDVVKDITDTKGLLEDFLKNKNNDDLYKKLYESLLLQLQNYYKLSESIKGIDRNSNKLNKRNEELNEIHEEKAKVEGELEKLEKDIIMLICKDSNLSNFYKENNKSFRHLLLKDFVKVFFISFCDFDNTCEKPLFKKDTLQSLKNGAVELFFKKDKNINIPDKRDLPFFLINDPDIIKDQQNEVGKDNLEEAGETVPARDEDGKYYCFWSDKLIIALDKKKKQVNDVGQLNIDKNEINEGNKINIHNPYNVDADYDSFENRALFKKTFELSECDFFERLADEECSRYSIKNIVEEVEKERKQELNHLLSFIEKIEKFIKEETKEAEEIKKKIENKDQTFFIEKKNKIETKYKQQIEDLGKCIDIAEKYKNKLDGEIEGFDVQIGQIDVEIDKLSKRFEDMSKIKKKLSDQACQPNTQGDGINSKCGEASKTQVSGEKNTVSIQPGDDEKELEKLRKEIEELSNKKSSIENYSKYQVIRVVHCIKNLIEELKEKKEKVNRVLGKNGNIDFEIYSYRVEKYSSYHNGKNTETLKVLSDLKVYINAVLKREKIPAFQSLEPYIKFEDIINFFNNDSFCRFVSMIKRGINEIISKNLNFDLYEYLCFGERKFKSVFVGSEQRFKGLWNIWNTCYIISILQNLVEFKDDLLLIKDFSKDAKSNQKEEIIHNTVFDVLGEKGTDPRIGLHNVLNISIINGFGNVGDPADVYSSLLNYYNNKQYRIEVVEGCELGDFVYKPLEGNGSSSFNAQLFLPSVGKKYKEIKDKGIIDYLYNNKEFNESIQEYNQVSQGPYVFKNTIIRKCCEECKGKEIKIEIDCSPYCMINIGEFIGKANNISEVVKETFDVGIEEDQMEGMECDFCKKKVAKVRRSSCYRVMNNCLCFNFVVSNRYDTNSIDIEDEVKVGNEVYESVCACYFAPSHHIAFKKINDIWFKFDDDKVSPIIYKSLPKMYKGCKPTLVFYKKKIKNKK